VLRRAKHAQKLHEMARWAMGECMADGGEKACGEAFVTPP
jgi:hypothetical protein